MRKILDGTVATVTAVCLLRSAVDSGESHINRDLDFSMYPVSGKTGLLLVTIDDNATVLTIDLDGWCKTDTLFSLIQISF